VPITRATCPECRAVATSADGFTAGEVVTCPKCGTYFDVPAVKPAAAVPAKPLPAKPVMKKPAGEVEDVEVEDDRPRPKKKALRDDDEDYDDRPKKRKKTGYQEYKSSPVRFVVLGVLVVVMLVMAFFLYQKMQRDRENERSLVPVARVLA
jgi:hypothetical protein